MAKRSSPTSQESRATEFGFQSAISQFAAEINIDTIEAVLRGDKFVS